MSTDAVQITIPDFDDDNDFNSTPVFGRSAGGLWGSSNSVQDSPITGTPVTERNERSYFHSRGDSVASEDSSHSIQYTSRKFKPPLAHSAHSSVVTTVNSPFAKKTSFASLRNAFKSAKSADSAPPVPSIDHQAYPVLKNPFNRSTSSLAHHVHGRPSIHASPSHFRPATPASGDSKVRGQSRTRGHTPAKSQHSHSGSIYHTSDVGSDYGHGLSTLPSSTPPVPPVPSGFGYVPQEDLEMEDDIVVEARTPADLALHAVFIRFTSSAEAIIDDFVSQPLDRDPHLNIFMGPGVDVKFDDLLQSLGKLAQKHAKPVVDAVMRWRKSQTDGNGFDVQRLYSASAKPPRTHDNTGLLTERRSLASIYIMCRALIAATQTMAKDSLSDALGNSLEELTFDQFNRRQDIKLLTHSANHRLNADLYATLLGNLANIRFETVTDRFLVELGPIAAGLVPKDADSKYEHLVKGLRHVEIKVWPPERFEEGAEFMESLSKSFEHTHGVRLKTVFAETLVHLLYSIGKTAQAEVNHPQWAKAMEIIYPKARDMANKPRYWQVAYPLVVASLCVAPREYFLKNWVVCVEASISKLKEKPFRITILNGILRLVWTYLYRCHEPASTVTMKLEALTKHFFPPNRLLVTPQEDHIEMFAYLIHFILSRQFDYGSELCLDLLQEKLVGSAQPSGVISHLAPDRMSIAVQAILLSLRLLEREESSPSWPPSSDFSQVPSWESYVSSSEFLAPTVLKSGWTDFLERCSACLSTIALACYQTVGKMSILDDQWSSSRLNPNYEEVHNYMIRQHPEGHVAYPSNLLPQISALQTCYQSWPRCLHSSLAMDAVFDMLLHGVVHVEPGIGDVASSALRRFMSDFQHACTLLSRFCHFLFSPQSITNEGSSLRLVVESSDILTLWISVFEKWAYTITERPRHSFTETERGAIYSLIDEVEAGALFMLSHTKRSVYSTGAKSVRRLAALITHFDPEPPSPNEERANTFSRIIDPLLYRSPFLENFNVCGDILDAEELDRLKIAKRSERPDTLMRVAESDQKLDRALWKQIFPALLRRSMEQQPTALVALREKIVAAITRYHPFIVQLSGINNKTHPGMPARTASVGDKDSARLISEHRSSIQQWHVWGMLACATAHISDARPMVNVPTRDHARARSELNVDREQMSTSRDLFRCFSLFLDSDHSIFRDSAVSCISSLPPFAYSHLLEDLNILPSRQFYDDPRTKTPTGTSTAGRARRQERFLTALARIYYLTAHHLQEQRSSAKQAALTSVLKYIRNTQILLSSPEHRELFSLQRLRRYFCGTVERFFDSLASLNDSDRFIPLGMHLSLYRMCEEWCQFGKQSENVKKRLIVMQTAAARSFQDAVGQAEIIKRFQTETKELSNAAVGAMASLIHKAYFPPEVSASGSPTDKPPVEQTRPLEASQVLDRLLAILAAFNNEPVQGCGKKALRSLLSHSPYDYLLSDEALRRAFVTKRVLDTSNARFFEVVADVICNMLHGFKFSQVVCLGLSNLCNPVLEIRRQAFNMLEIIHEQSSGIISMAQYEAAIGSSAPSAYLHAHRLISDILSGEHPDKAGDVLAQFSGWIPRVYANSGDDDKNNSMDGGPLILLQSLEYWVPSINLMAKDRSGLSREGRSAIYHLMALTSRYAESHAEQILVLWTRLVDAPYQSNGHAVIRFLLEQAHKVGNAMFINCSSKVVACLSQSVIGRQLFQELCSVIEPARMLPSLEHKLGMPDTEDLELWSDLDILFSEQPRLSLGVAQFSLLFLSECAMERYWELQDQLPILLQALFMHLDHRQPFVQQRCRHMLFQLLRSCLSGYDELTDRSLYQTRSDLKSLILKLERSVDDLLWKEDDSGAEAESKMKRLSSEVVGFLEPLHTTLTEKWGSLALSWSTTCAIRPIAFRSLQLFRALQPKVGQGELGNLIARLSNSIAGEDPSLQDFAVELLITLTSMASSSDLDMALLPQMFWCAMACLSTTVEDEYRHVLNFLDALLMRLDLDDPLTADLLLSHRPIEWRGTFSLQAALLTGLRSSQTSDATFRLLQQLSKVADARLIDPSEGRVRDLYTLSLPWCFHAMSVESNDEALQEFALNISHLADLEERPSITRIMTSFAKNRFRTKEDFLRQSVASLREHYGADHWTEVVTLLVGLVLNQERWLRVHTLQIIKVLFQQRETRSSVDVLGSELLMPLLRLLETDLAMEALDVMDEPMRISGGPSVKHILRMSLHHHLGADRKEVESVAEVFGIAQESGWCVPRSSALRDDCRANLCAVFDICKAPSRPSRIDFQLEEMSVLTEEPLEGDLGDLVQNLHELSSFFQEGRQTFAISNRQLEARVAAILAKSTDTSVDTPQTPFVDIFDIESLSSYDASDISSHSDSESDLFEFDSFTGR